MALYPDLPPGQFPATQSNTDALAGRVGEYLSSTIASGSAIALTTTVSANVTSISLTPGDWDVFGSIVYTGSSGSVSLNGSLNTVSATMSFTPGQYANIGTATMSTIPTLPIGPHRFSLSATTTVYLVVNAVFGAGTVSAYGIIRARRIR